MNRSTISIGSNLLALAIHGPMLRARIDGESTGQCAYNVFFDVEAMGESFALVLRGQDKTVVGKGKGVTRAEYAKLVSARDESKGAYEAIVISEDAYNALGESERAEYDTRHDGAYSRMDEAQKAIDDKRESMEQWNDSTGAYRQFPIATGDKATLDALQSAIVSFFKNPAAPIADASPELLSILPALVGIFGARTPSGAVGSFAALKNEAQQKSAKELDTLAKKLREAVAARASVESTPDPKIAEGLAQIESLLASIGA